MSISSDNYKIAKGWTGYGIIEYLERGFNSWNNDAVRSPRPEDYREQGQFDIVKLEGKSMADYTADFSSKSSTGVIHDLSNGKILLSYVNKAYKQLQQEIGQLYELDEDLVKKYQDFTKDFESALENGIDREIARQVTEKFIDLQTALRKNQGLEREEVSKQENSSIIR